MAQPIHDCLASKRAKKQLPATSHYIEPYCDDNSHTRRFRRCSDEISRANLPFEGFDLLLQLLQLLHVFQSKSKRRLHHGLIALTSKQPLQIDVDLSLIEHCAKSSSPVGSTGQDRTQTCKRSHPLSLFQHPSSKSWLIQDLETKLALGRPLQLHPQTLENAVHSEVYSNRLQNVASQIMYRGCAMAIACWESTLPVPSYDS